MLKEDKLLAIGYDALVQINEKKVIETAREWMENKYEPRKLLNKLAEAMVEIGRKFDEKEYFLAQFILSSNIMENVTKMILEEAAVTEMVPEHKGTIIMGTVKNDIHDLGKKIAASMLRVEGFTVIDLGKEERRRHTRQVGPAFQVQPKNGKVREFLHLQGRPGIAGP